MMESTSCVLSFRMVFFYLVTTGRVFDISLCENSISQSIKELLSLHSQCSHLNLSTDYLEGLDAFRYF